jgi:uncharacterized protein (TIGR02145 family)
MKSKNLIPYLFAALFLLSNCKIEELVKVSKVNIGSVQSYTQTTAIVNGEVVDVGTNASNYGHCWSKSSMPLISDNFKDKGGTVVKGNYTTDIPDLEQNTTYFVRAYVKEESNVIYSIKDVSFTTSAYQLPAVSTDVVNAFTHNTAMAGGNVSSDGGDDVTDRGICWGTSANPTINDNHRSNGVGTGNFSIEITSLNPNTLYHVRAFATNSVGTNYGNQEEFTTLLAPFITVKSPTIDSLWEMGFNKQIVWEDNITENVKIELFKVGSASHDIISSVSSSGTYNWLIPENLSAANNYAIKISSVNNANISDTSETFEIFGKISDIEGNKYRIVKIGTQWWMRENLRSTKYADNYQIPVITGSTNWNNLTTDDIGCCYYNDNTTYGSDYGVLYTWVTTMKGNYIEKTQGICPSGWHIPSDSEWKDLEKYLGMSVANADATGWRGNNEGNVLKETGILHWTSSNGTNVKGFTALGSGYRTDTGVSNGLKLYSSYWVSNYSGYTAWCRQLHNDVGTINRNLVTWLNGYSVRCVKD